METVYDGKSGKLPKSLRRQIGQNSDVKKVRNTWRPNREDLVTMWSELVPRLHGRPLRHVLDSLPVFNGRKLDPGFYIQNEIRPYGASSDFQFAPLYIKGDGYMMWAHPPAYLTGTNAIPPWLPTLTIDGYAVVDTQNSPVDIVVRNANGSVVFTNFYHTSAGYEPNGWPYGNGWFLPADLRMENFPQGLYRATVTMEQFIPYDSGAREEHYFFGIQGLNQNRDEDYVILIGVDGVSAGTVQLTLQGTNYSAPLVNGAAWFRSKQWPFDLSGNVAVTVTDPQGRSRAYQRTLLECGSSHSFFQQQFIIVDRDFDGVEDPYDARLRLAPPQWIDNAARLVATRPAPHTLNAATGTITLLAATNLALPATNWTRLGPGQSLNGKLQWDDPGAATNHQRYYHVLEEL